MSRSGCSACSVAPAMATTIGVRSWSASTPGAEAEAGRRRAGGAEQANASGPVVSAVQKDR